MPTTDEILSLTSMGIRVDAYRFDLLDFDLTKVGEVHPDESSAPTIENNVDRTVKRTLSGFKLPPSESADINTISSRVRPVMILENGAEFPLGVFLFGDDNRPVNSWGTSLEASLVDANFILDQPTDFTFSVNSGDPVQAAMEKLALSASIPNVQIDPAAANIRAPAVWPAGTSRYDILNQLGDTAGHYAPYFDNAGTLRSKRMAISADDLIPDHTYGSGGIIVSDTITITNDLLSASNRYIIIDTSSPDTPIVGVFDVPASQPHSIFNRGFVVATVVNQQGVDNSYAASVMARNYAYGAHDTYEWVSFDAAQDPRLDTYEVVQYEQLVYQLQSWSRVLRSGEHDKINLRRVYDVIG